MDNKFPASLVELFERLSLEARSKPKAGCRNRAWDLARELANLGRFSIVELSPRNGKPLLPKSFPGVKWYWHYFVKSQGMVLDPSLGRIVPSRDYLSAVLQNNPENVRFKVKKYKGSKNLERDYIRSSLGGVF